ncbi:MAG: PASTA domain-containing protein [Mollicutes bacterium]|nr:PASTA domain-containing protein [Mollicutes bacterium]
MKRVKRRLRKINGFSKFLYLFLIIFYIISFLFFAAHIISLSGIETVIRYLVLIASVLYLLYYVKVGLKILIKKKYFSYYILSFVTIVIIAVFLISSTAINFLFSMLGNIKEQRYITYSSNLIVLKDNKINKKSVFAMIDDKDDIEGYILAKKIIKNNRLKQEIKEYDDYLSMLYALYEKEVDGIFISGNYKTIYSSESDFADIGEATKVLYSIKERRINKSFKKSSSKRLTEPFTVLVMGVDSEYEGLDANAVFNGDTLILATFNPKTYNVTLVSFPRDTLVKIACRNRIYKINSSAGYGNSCVIDTVENLTGIKVDYYVKINFKGVVDLVESLGGIEVDVEKPHTTVHSTGGFYFDCKGRICEQDSLRRWGKYTVYIDKPGYQTLNGEQALAYARCRHLYASQDLARNKHQQDVIVAIAQKALKIRNINELKKVIDAISKNISTNMNTNQLLSSYGSLKEMILNIIGEDDFISIQRSYLETYPITVDIGINDIRNRSSLGYYKDSLDNIVKHMKINLNIIEPKIIKTFSMDINNPYEMIIAGKDYRKNKTYETYKNLIGAKKEEALSYCDEYGFNCETIYIDSASQYYNDSYSEDTIAYHIPKPNSLIEGNKTIKLYIIGKKESDI